MGQNPKFTRFFWMAPLWSISYIKYVTLVCTCLVDRVVSALQDSRVCLQAGKQFKVLLPDDATSRMSNVGHMQPVSAIRMANLSLDDTTTVIVKTDSWHLPVS